MTLEELKAAEKSAFDKVIQIEKEVLEPAKMTWRKLLYDLRKAEEDAAIEAEVNRRLAVKGAK